MTGYDVIGDVHGRADKLVGLLRRLGYRESGGTWRHDDRDRQVVFVGDLIDRGIQQRDTVRIARSMVEGGTAQIVLGNHEFNAIAYATWNEERSDFCRSRVGEKGTKHHRQHKAFIAEVGLDNSEATDMLDWFRTIPLWLDLGGLRVVHACWANADIDHLRPLVSPTGSVTEQIVVDGTDPERTHPTYNAIETVLKGPEIDLGGRVYVDKGGDKRGQARRCWWDPDATTLRSAALIPEGTNGTDGQPFPDLPDDPLDGVDHVYDDSVPVIVGHYWETGTPKRYGPKVACVDYSAGKGGPLVAYRWNDGDADLTDGRFVSF